MRMIRRFLTLFLALVLAVSLIQIPALALDVEDGGSSSTVEETAGETGGGDASDESESAGEEAAETKETTGLEETDGEGETDREDEADGVSETDGENQASGENESLNVGAGEAGNPDQQPQGDGTELPPVDMDQPATPPAPEEEIDGDMLVEPEPVALMLPPPLPAASKYTHWVENPFGSSLQSGCLIGNEDGQWFTYCVEETGAIYPVPPLEGQGNTYYLTDDTVKAQDTVAKVLTAGYPVEGVAAVKVLADSLGMSDISRAFWTQEVIWAVQANDYRRISSGAYTKALWEYAVDGTFGGEELSRPADITVLSGLDSDGSISLNYQDGRYTGELVLSHVPADFTVTSASQGLSLSLNGAPLTAGEPAGEAISTPTLTVSADSADFKGSLHITYNTETAVTDLKLFATDIRGYENKPYQKMLGYRLITTSSSLDALAFSVNQPADAKGSLTVTKAFSGTVPDDFTAVFQVRDSDGNTVARAHYSDFTNGSYTFGPLPVGFYQVVETDASTPSGWSLTTSYSADSVEVKHNETAALTVTNAYEQDPGVPGGGDPVNPGDPDQPDTPGDPGDSGWSNDPGYPVTPPSTDIPDGEVPLAELPESGDAAEEDPVDLPDGEVPLADAPETGDAILLWAAAAAVSLAGLLYLVFAPRKRKDI